MQKSARRCLCLLIILCGEFVFSQVEPPKGPLVLKAARLVDVRAGAIVVSAVVVIENGKVSASGSNLAIPKGARVVELGDLTLMPGLIDCHTHLLLAFDGGKSDEENSLLTTLQMSTAKRALMGAADAREMLEAGFTTVRDLGNSGYEGDLALRDAINAGWVQGPRMVVSSRALSAVGGQAPSVVAKAQELIAEEYAVVTGADEARRAVRQAAYDGADWIKVIVDGSVNTLSLDEVRAIVQEAHAVNLRVAAHATSDTAVRIAVAAGVDSVEHAYEVSDETLAMMSAKHIFLVPTDRPITSYLGSGSLTGKAREDAETRMKPFVTANGERLQRAAKAGVKIASGSDTYYRRGDETRGQSSMRMFEAYAATNMPPIEVLRTGTLNAAELLRLPIGSIEAGRDADIIAVQGDPLKDISSLNHVIFVMKAGQIVRNDVVQSAPR